MVSESSKALLSIEGVTDKRCDIALILGSGLGYLGEDVENAVKIAYKDIDGFPVATAPGHNGQLILGEWCGRRVAILDGRFHLYEGWQATEIALPIRTLRALGAEHMIVTNAAGGLNAAYKPGEIMLIEDHLNFTGANPLIGPNDDAIGLRFPDMSRAYDPDLLQLTKILLNNNDIAHHAGIYAGVTGPSLETSAERRFYRSAGADAIGMSTVMEVIAAVHAGMRVVGLSAITNVATGAPDQQPDTIEDVHANARIAAAQLHTALTLLLPQL